MQSTDGVQGADMGTGRAARGEVGPATPPSPWVPSLSLLAGALAVLGAAFAPTLAAMAHIWWTSGTFAHGMVVYPIVIWLIWRDRGRLGGMTPRVEPWGLPALGVLLLGWFVAWVMDVMVVQQLAVTAMIVVLCLLFLGRAVVRELWFPLAYMFFAVPFGEGLIPVLMHFTAAFTVEAVQLTGIPIYRDGMAFSLPSGNFEVATACSGIRYLIASTALGTLYAYLTYRSFWRRAVFVLAAVLVPVVANGFRAFGIVMLAHLSSMRLAVGLDHLIYGWVFFGVVIFALFWVGSLFREDELPVPTAAGDSAQAGQGGSAAGARAGGRNGRYPPRSAALVLVLASTAIGLSAGTGRRITSTPPSGVAAVPGVPVAPPGWQGPLARQADWDVHYPGGGEVLRAAYQRVSDGAFVDVAVVVHDPVGSGASGELVNSVNRDAHGWGVLLSPQRIELGKQEPPLGPTAVNAAAWNHLGRQRVTWQWYVVSDQAVVSPVLVKLQQLELTFLRQGRPGASIIVSAERGDEQLHSALLGDFLAAAGARLSACAVADTVRQDCRTGAAQ